MEENTDGNASVNEQDSRNARALWVNISVRTGTRYRLLVPIFVFIVILVMPVAALTWVNETVGYGFDSSLALDNLGKPHISYFNFAEDALKYATWTGTTWQISTVDSQGTGRYSSLVLDGLGRPHIS